MCQMDQLAEAVVFVNVVKDKILADNTSDCDIVSLSVP